MSILINWPKNLYQHIINVHDNLFQVEFSIHTVGVHIQTKARSKSNLDNMSSVDIEFGRKEWELMDKIIQILKPFYEITEMLSKHDASISVATPCVTLILDSLKENRSKVMSLCFPFMWFFMEAVV